MNKFDSPKIMAEPGRSLADEAAILSQWSTYAQTLSSLGAAPPTDSAAEERAWWAAVEASWAQSAAAAAQTTQSRAGERDVIELATETAWWASAEASWAQAQADAAMADLHVVNAAFEEAQRKYSIGANHSDAKLIAAAWRRLQAHQRTQGRIIGAASELIRRLPLADRRAKLIAVGGSGLLHIGLRPVSTAFGEWHYILEEWRRVAMMIINCRCHAAWRTWRACHDEALRALGVLRRSVAYWMHREMSRLWNVWLIIHRARRERLDQSRHAFTLCMKRAEARALRGWHEMCDTRNVQLLTARRFLAALINKRLAYGFRAIRMVC